MSLRLLVVVHERVAIRDFSLSVSVLPIRRFDMSEPVIQIQNQDQPKAAALHLLPCTIHHDGPVDPVQGYWKPSDGEHGNKTAFFRGRKLLGKAIKVPESHKGVVVARSENQQPNESAADDATADAEEHTATLTMDSKAEFDELVVWGHETTADTSSDPYVRGIEEWVTLADQVHSY